MHDVVACCYTKRRQAINCLNGRLKLDSPTLFIIHGYLDLVVVHRFYRSRVLVRRLRLASPRKKSDARETLTRGQRECRAHYRRGGAMVFARPRVLVTPKTAIVHWLLAKKKFHVLLSRRSLSRTRRDNHSQCWK